MFDTNVTIVGNVLHGPEWRKTANTGALVTTFKIASTARRYDRQTGQWMDGNSLRVRVNCWRALAANVKESVALGDPLIVTGRLFTRDWVDEHGNKRLQYEVEATSVGHDLSRGKSIFQRRRVSTATSVIDDAEAQQRIGGEPTVPVPDDEAPTQFDDTPFEVAVDRFANQPPDDGELPPAGGFVPELEESPEPVGVAEPDESLAPVLSEPDEPGEAVLPGEADPPTGADQPVEPEQTDGNDAGAGATEGGDELDPAAVTQAVEPSHRRRGLRRVRVAP
ncbi:MAG TPA: single-stranded DNA-binding protein [Natronosporangium sp.]